MIQNAEGSMNFLKSEVPRSLDSDARSVMKLSQQLFETANYFSAKIKQKVNKADKSISWFTYSLNSKETASEISLHKKNIKLDRSVDNTTTAEVMASKIEQYSFLNASFKLFFEYYSNRYEGIEESSNMNDKKMMEFLKALRVLFILTSGKFRKLPLFMMRVDIEV
jgi:hypothetical protein